MSLNAVTYWLVTVRKANRDEGPKHVGGGKFRQPHRLSGPIYMLLSDFSDPSMWMSEFSVTHMFWSCVKLGFFFN
jgi:hypothetical protein